jgi:hypothetical protein
VEQWVEQDKQLKSLELVEQLLRMQGRMLCQQAELWSGQGEQLKREGALA